MWHRWTAPSTFSLYTYHGPKRESSVAALAKYAPQTCVGCMHAALAKSPCGPHALQYDVVLTTYSTLPDQQCVLFIDIWCYLYDRRYDGLLLPDQQRVQQMLAARSAPSHLRQVRGRQ